MALHVSKLRWGRLSDDGGRPSRMVSDSRETATDGRGDMHHFFEEAQLSSFRLFSVFCSNLNPYLDTLLTSFTHLATSPILVSFSPFFSR